MQSLILRQAHLTRGVFHIQPLTVVVDSLVVVENEDDDDHDHEHEEDGSSNHRHQLHRTPAGWGFVIFQVSLGEKGGETNTGSFRKLSLLQCSLRTFFLYFNYPLRAKTILACCSRMVKDTSNNSGNMGRISSAGRQTTGKTHRR